MMFRGRQTATANCRLLISANRRHFFLIDSHQQSQLNNQIQRRQFGVLNLFASNGGKKEQKQYTQVDGNSSNKMLLLEQQKRFFATDETSEWLEEKEQQQQYIENASSEEQRKLPAGRRDLDKKMLRLSNSVVLYVNLMQGNVKKFFKLDKAYTEQGGRVVHTPFPHLTLDVAYQMVNSMDALLRTLATQHQATMNSSNASGPVVLESQRVNDDFYDFQLELVRLGNAYEFKINSIKTVQEHKERELRLPIRALPWLRHTMAQMLVEHDGSQQLGPAPPELPESILQARPVVAQNRPQLRNQQQATGNFPTNNQSAFNKQPQQSDQGEASQQQLLLQLVQQQLQQLQQQQQSLPNYSFQFQQPSPQPQQQYQQFMATPNSSLVQLAANQQQQQLAQLRAQLAQLEAAVAATTAMSMQTNPLQYHQQQQNAVIPVGFVQQQLQPPLPFYGGPQQQQQFPLPPSFLPFGASPPPLQQQPAPINIQNQNAAAASTAALLNQLQQLLMMAGQMNQPQQGRKATMTTTTASQQNAFPTKRPANQQQQQQTAAGQWNRLPQQPMNRQYQQQTAGAAGQASTRMMNSGSSRSAMVNNTYKQSSPPPTNKATTTASGTRVESVRAREVKMEKEGKGGEKHMNEEEKGKDEDIFELFSEVEALAEETEKWLEEKKKKPVEMEVEEKAGMEEKEEEEKVAGDEMTREDEEDQAKLKGEVDEERKKEELEEDEERKMKKEEEETSVDEVLLKEKMAATAGGN